MESVYIVYHHEGHRLNPVHPVTYRAGRRAVIRGDGAGQVTIPATLHVHRPFPIETHPALVMDLVYAPRLHNAVGSITAGTNSVAGLFQIEHDRRRLTMADLGSQPERWEGTLRNLSSMIHRLHDRRDSQLLPARRDPATAALLNELIAHFRREYAAFLDRYRDTARPRPDQPAFLQFAPEDERQRWREMIGEHLAREPRWGMLIERLYRDELEAFAVIGTQPR